ncbi:MAG: protein translocase subunit SecD [Candidatus Pacebacteria bacterium]|nr:protein translocase subunit SecD [Candidatus Paceibacterota bacterium]
MNYRAYRFSFTIILITAVAAIFLSPQLFDAHYTLRPWKLGLDLVGGSHLVYEIDLKNIPANDRESVAAGLRDVIEKRVNLFGVSEPQVYATKSGESSRLVVELAGINDVKEAIKQIGATPSLYFAKKVEFEAEGGKKVPAYQQTTLTGRYIKGAQLSFDNTTNAPQISLSFNDEGAKIFGELTGELVGKPLAIFLDDKLISEPTVQEKITGGKAQITGRFTLKEAKDMVARFNAGALPAPINLISQQTVGASLGRDSLHKTLYAGLLGMALVVMFMMLYYRASGVVASFALVIYAILTLAIFKLFGITMTLSGITGFILSIGMAVDANVLIFERSKEERRKGAAPEIALEEGFRRAWPSVRDSNITTMITAFVLYYITTGFVKGFALTLFLGVLMSMFSAITVSRALLRSLTVKQ